MNELNLKVESVNGEVIIREGVALEQKPPVKVTLVGIISSPGDFALKRKDTFPALKTNVVANYTNRTIVLTCNESDFYSHSVTGKLELFPDLKKLQINDSKMYDEKELFRMLNFYGTYFKDKAAHKTLLARLQEFKAKVTQEFVNADDYKGSAAIEKITNIEHKIPLNFTLAIPMFTGGAVKTFKVDICVAVRDGGVSFWFESVELHELMTKETETVFDAELKRLTDFIIIKQW